MQLRSEQSTIRSRPASSATIAAAATPASKRSDVYATAANATDAAEWRNDGWKP